MDLTNCKCGERRPRDPEGRLYGTEGGPSETPKATPASRGVIEALVDLEQYAGRFRMVVERLEHRLEPIMIRSRMEGRKSFEPPVCQREHSDISQSISGATCSLLHTFHVLGCILECVDGETVPPPDSDPVPTSTECDKDSPMDMLIIAGQVADLCMERVKILGDSLLFLLGGMEPAPGAWAEDQTSDCAMERLIEVCRRKVMDAAVAVRHIDGSLRLPNTEVANG